MSIALFILVSALQVTPPPAPPILVSPAPSPVPSVAPSPSPSLSPSPPVLTISATGVNLHPSQAQTVTVTNASGAIVAQTSTPLVTVAVDQTARSVTITASAQTGRTVLTVSDASGANVQVPVRVALDAGVVPSDVSLRVTGNSVDPAWVQAQVQRVLVQAIQLQPGAVLQQPFSFTLPAAFSPGSTAAVPVSINISGGDQYFDVASAPVSVNVQNVDAPPFQTPLLFYDDDPEHITANGVLYRGQVTQAAPARLYYYHENTNDQHRLFVLLSSASTQDPSTVQLIDASAGPNIDVLTVGHAVTRDFLLQQPQNEGTVVDVTPQAPYIADQFLLDRLQGAAGTIGFHLLSGGPVNVTVISAPASATAADLAAYLNQPNLPGDGHHRTGVFDISKYAQETIAYTAGGPDAMTQYGAQSPPSADPGSNRHDYGEYGVMRTLTFDVDNPSGKTATAYLYERPLGGVVRSSFLVNGTLYQVGCARVSDRYLIGQPLALGPGKSQITIQTMTDGGSSYPLEVGLTSTPPQSTTPPISAPNGCFPKATPTPMSSPQI